MSDKMTSVYADHTAFPNAKIGENTLIEAGAIVGHRYHADCGPAVIGADCIIRAGAIIYGDVTLGRYFQSGHHTIIRAKVTAGDYCTVSNHSTLEGIIELGEGVRIMSHVYIPSRTRIGSNTFVGPGTTMLNDKLPGRLDKMPMPKGPTIEDDVVIGGGCTLLPGVRIGRQSFVAAGTLVTKDVPPHSMVVGSPGRISPLPENLDRPNNRKLTIQPVDIWHPATPDLSKVDWPKE